jgi:asparagine synthase (glutamine-hydrolysing)
LCLDSTKLRQLPDPIPYWSLKTVVEAGQRNPFQGSELEAIDHLETLLKDAICQQMIADVPLGAFLSGGIDSSTIVALMQAQSNQPIKTFSIGFQEDSFNEAPFAKAIANHLGTDHTELYVGPQQTLEVIPQLPTLYDEPFADSSQIPTFLLAKMTRQYVTVSLSGDAGDELFAGYNRYFTLLEKDHLMRQMPQWQKTFFNRVPSKVKSAIIRTLRFAGAGGKANHVAYTRPLPGGVLYSPEAYYRLVQLSHWQPEMLVLHAQEHPTVLSDQARWADVDDMIARATYFDLAMYLPDDILVKVDRASMGVSLESRIPLLDHRVVEFSQHLPLSMKIRGKQGKWALRQVLSRYVPDELIERPKQGFAAPIDQWLRKDLREWGESLLNKTRLQNEGFLNADIIHKYWQDHQLGIRKADYLLWDVLMFQAWLDS